MRWHYLIVAVACASTGAAAQQSTDSTRRADSAAAARGLERIRNEPRVAPDDTTGALPLSRRDAIAAALAHNPQLLAAREQVNEARARVVQATAIPEPTLGYTWVGQNGPFTPSAAPEHDLALGVTIPFPDRIRLAGNVAGADVRSSELAYEQLRQLLASQTSQTYDSLLVAARHVVDLTDARQLAQDFLVRTQARYDAGTTPKLDVLKAKVDLAQAVNALLAGERDVLNARAGLNRLLGRTLGAPIRATDTLTIPDTVPALELLEPRAQQVRPELRSLAAQRAGARAATSLAREYWLPDIGISVSRNTVAGEGTTFDTGIGIGFPLFFWQHSRGEIAEARHRERELAATNRDLSAQVSQEVRVAFATARTAFQQARYIRDELLPEAQQAYKVASTSYALGGSSALEVLDAKRDLLDAQTQYTDALGNLNDALAQLELAVGAPLDTLSTGESHD